MFDVRFAGNVDWIWDSSRGCLYLADEQDVRTLIAVGYSGAVGAQNDPRREGERAVGPIPRGVWLLDPPVSSHPRLGPVVIPLEARDAATAQGRSAFFIHGDNSAGDGSASKGCIILSRKTRDIIAAFYWAGVRVLTVV